MEKISIIIPVYNVEAYLQACLDSTLAQTYKNLEIILVNDGSTDKSGSICDQYAEQDSRIIVIHKDNAGVSAARNDGLKIATGEYICFIDSDDTVSPKLISSLYEKIEQFDVDMVICGIEQHLPGGIIANNCSSLPSCVVENKDQLFINFFDKLPYREVLYGPVNKLIKRQIASKVAFDERFKIGEDLLFSFECIEATTGIYIIPDTLYHYIKHPGSAMTSAFSMKRYDYIKVADILLEKCKKHHASAYTSALKWTWIHKLNFCWSLCRQKMLLRQNHAIFEKEVTFLQEKFRDVKRTLNFKQRTKFTIIQLAKYIS